jgi:C4-type Zn-finger protein
MPLNPALSGLLASRSKEFTAAPRESDMPVCPVCADTLIAAEASSLLPDNSIEYVWCCENCGYGFISKHKTRAFVCH